MRSKQTHTHTQTQTHAQSRVYSTKMIADLTWSRWYLAAILHVQVRQVSRQFSTRHTIQREKVSVGKDEKQKTNTTQFNSNRQHTNKNEKEENDCRGEASFKKCGTKIKITIHRTYERNESSRNCTKNLRNRIESKTDRCGAERRMRQSNRIECIRMCVHAENRSAYPHTNTCTQTDRVIRRWQRSH